MLPICDMPMVEKLSDKADIARATATVRGRVGIVLTRKELQILLLFPKIFPSVDSSAL